MAEEFLEEERERAFAIFMDGVTSLSTDENFRRVVSELDGCGREVVERAAADPAGYLRLRGVELPEGFQATIVPEHPQGPTGPGITVPVRCYCIRICFLWWCWTVCICVGFGADAETA